MKSKTPSPPKTTYEKVLKLVQENAKDRKESAKDRKESAKDRKESAKERKKISEYIKAMQEQGDRDRKKIDESIKAMHRELGGISNSNGEVAEAYFINSFSNCMQFAGQSYDGYFANLKKKNRLINLQGEYDLVLFNCASVVVIEIKYNADKKDVEMFVEKAPIFKQLFPEYAGCDLYLGLAAFHINKGAEKESIKQGIAIIKQVGDTMVINDEHLKVF